MAYTFTSAELQEIQTAYQIAEASTADASKGKFKSVYDLIYDILTIDGLFYDAPVEGLEENVWIWIGGARDVNAGEGFFADFIREYTRAQHEQRYHQTLSEEDLNIASNAIARNFINDILEGTTPTIEELGLIDAAPVAGSIFNQVFPANYTPWSGTLLFPFLGIESYYQDWLLTDQSVGQFKPLEGTYDLISTAAAAIPLTNSPFAIASNLISTFGFSGTINAFKTTQKLAAETNSFINSHYQLDKFDFDFDLGGDLLSLGTKSANYIVGTLGSDSYSKNPLQNLSVNGTANVDIIHAGLGDDVIFAASGNDLIEGGKGNDIIDAGDGDDLIIGGEGADAIIVGSGSDYILGGENADRLYIRGSDIGLGKIDGADRLFPLLGGVSSYVTFADFSGNTFVPDSYYYDTDEDGNIEYWYSSTLADIDFSGPGNGGTVLGDNVLANLSLNQFAILYEMNGTDLEISFYNGIPLSPFFTTSDELGAGQLWNVDALNNFVPPSFMVTLSEHQSGQYGILLNGPLKLGATKIDNANGDPDAAAIASHNQAVAYITNNGQFNLTLGEMVSRSPLTNSETGQPLEFITKTGPGDDQNIGDETDENINGEAGDDIIDGREGDDEIEGGFGDDQISGGEGDDILSGGAGDDVIYGCAGSDQQKGGSGIDTISYASSGSGVSVDFSNNTVSGGDAEGDTIEGFEIAVGSAFDDSLTGGASADQFFGGNGNDVLFGNEGDDLLVGGNGADFIDGGAGLDTASYHNSAASIMVDLINQVASGGSAEGDMLSSIEGVIGGNFADTIIGNNLNNHLFGGAGDDVIFGGTGDDTIEGGQGADILDGGEGIDTLSFASATEAVSVSLNQAATLELSLFNLSLIETNLLEPDQFTGFENLNGSAFDDFLEGDAGDNVLWGGNGDDTFYATAGADVILGGAGSDTLDFIESFEAIELDLANRVYSGGYAEAIDIKSIENIYGTSFDDLIIGNAADNILNGSAGNDQLQGGAGDDQINGGAGTDDTAIFTGTLADYKITRAGGDSLRFEDLRTSQLSDGIDLVSEVENFQFSDGIAALLDLTIANAAPDLGDDLGLSANEDQIIIIDPLTLLANDAEYDGETLTITEVFNAKHGEVQLLGNGTIEFTPDQNYNGTASFEYRATDGVTMPASAKVSINYQPVTDAPVANFDGFLNIYAGQPTLISKEDLFFNDQEFDGQQLEITELVSVSGGTATLTTEGDVLFTPSVNSGEEITFEYKAGFVDENNNLVTSDFATVLATLQQPLSYTAEDDQFEGNENQPLVIQQADLFGNDINGGANSATILEVLSVSNGSVILDQQGNLIFTPETGFSGIAGFTYRAGNNQGGEDTASVNINIIADQQNAPPVAVDDNGLAALTTNEDTPLVIEAATLLQNDSDPDDDTLTIISVMDASNGTVVLGQGGNILFTPDENYNGTASFSYLLSDNNGNQDTATVTLDVVSVNDAPEELTLSNMNIDENSPEGTLIGELAATDPDLNETFTYAITGGDGAALFEILQNQLVLKSRVVLDFEQQSEYGLVIQATDSGNLSIENGFTISINDILESGAIIGTPFDDVLQGGAADDIISGLAGNDILFGGAGNDLLIGGKGADDIYGGEGIDTVDYSGSTSGINLTLTTLGITSYGIGIGGSASGDNLRDIENVIGSGHGDLIIGNQQENLIDGGAGRDYLAGGSGADQFIFKEDYGKDTILDFDTSGAIFDKIVIDFEGIDNFADLSSHIEGHGWFNLSTRITSIIMTSLPCLASGQMS